MTDTFSVLTAKAAIALIVASKGTDDFLILSRCAGEDFNGNPSSVLIYEHIESGAIYSLPYSVERYDDGTTGVTLINGIVELEGYGDIQYTPVAKISEVPDTIESLLA